jgi:hypothetical protein
VDLQWRTDAVLRPGQSVVLVNVTSRAALIESLARLRPGASTELQLTRNLERLAIKGRLDRCFVAALEPLRYRGVLLFEHRLALESRTA